MLTPFLTSLKSNSLLFYSFGVNLVVLAFFSHHPSSFTELTVQA